MLSRKKIFLSTLLFLSATIILCVPAFAEEKEALSEENKVIHPTPLEAPSGNQAIAEEDIKVAPNNQTLSVKGDQAVEYKAGLYYTVKKGDTLWGLSKKFFDSPWVWPSLWEENHQIPNPHLIYPGNRIRLYLREGVDLTSFPELEAESAPIEIVEESQNKEEEIAGETAGASQKDLPFYEYSLMDLVGFIKEEPVAAHGVIFKSRDDKQLLSSRDIVYVKQTGDAPLITGSLYTVYNTIEEPILDKKTGERVGIQHYLRGIIEIMEIVKNDPGIAMARVVKNFRDIEVDNFIMPYKRKSSKITLCESEKDLQGKLLVSEEHQKVFGENTIAFINRGEKDGVKPGQEYSIYKNEKIMHTEKNAWFKRDKVEETLMPIDFGKLIVLHTEQTTATVIILSSSQNVEPEANIRTLVQ